MNITWYGQSCFQINTSSPNNNKVNIIIDPFSPEIGLKPPSTEADILLITHNHPDHNNIKTIKGAPFIIDGPGEYEIKGIYIKGFYGYHDNLNGKEKGRITIYTIEAEGIKICHLSDLGQKELKEEQLEKIGDVDILMIPIGGEYTINANEAIKIMAQIEPKITIPMHYQIPKLKAKLESIDKFFKILGIKKIEPLPKLSIKKKDISEEEAKIIILTP